MSWSKLLQTRYGEHEALLHRAVALLQADTRVVAAWLFGSRGHLDWHCLFNGGRADIFEVTVKLAKEYGLAVRVFDRSTGEALRRKGLPTNEHDVLDSYRLDTAGKSARFAQMLHDLPVGLSEWAVHPGLEDGELLAIDPDGARRRQTDFNFLISAQAREIIQREGITLLSYKPLQEAWQAS